MSQSIDACINYDIVDEYESPELERDWHAVISLTLRELIEDGVVDFSLKEWDFDSYNKEQRDRIWQKFTTRYYFREIGLIPYAKWKLRVLGKLNEIMPKYKWAYAALDEGINPWQVGSEYNKSRSIDSDFPQTMLSGNSDYASYGRDFEHEKIQLGDFMEKMDSLKSIQYIDSMILDELEVMFSSLVTVSMNAR